MCCETKHVFFVCVQKLLLWLYLLLCNIISPQFHLPCPLESSFALNQGLLRSNLRLLLPSLHSCRDGGVEPPEGTKQEDDQHANHPDGHQQGTVPLFDLLLSNNDLLAGVDVVLHAEHPVGADEDKDDDGHAPVRDQHCILQFLLLDLKRMRKFISSSFQCKPFLILPQHVVHRSS